MDFKFMDSKKVWKGVLLILSILIVLSFIYMLKKFRGVFVFLFSRFWGQVILLLLVWVVTLYHFFYGILIGLFFVLIGTVLHLGYISGVKEGFGDSEGGFGVGAGMYGYRGTGEWPSSLVDDFQSYQATYLPQYTYDMAVLQKQAAPWEVEMLLRDRVWPWSNEVKKMYRGYVSENWFVSVDPGEALNNAMAVYNQAAIVQMMALNTKEGSFLLNGVVNGHTEGVPANKNNVVVCGDEGRMVQKKVIGFSGIWGTLMEDSTALDDADLPAVVPGFSFLGGEACNPCGALGSVPDYSCAFRLNTGDGGSVSPIWKMIWGL